MGSVCCTLRDIQGHFQQPSDASVEAGHLTKGLYQYRALLLQLFIFLTLAVLSFLVSTMSRGEFGGNLETHSLGKGGKYLLFCQHELSSSFKNPAHEFGFQRVVGNKEIFNNVHFLKHESERFSKDFRGCEMEWWQHGFPPLPGCFHHNGLRRPVCDLGHCHSSPSRVSSSRPVSTMRLRYRTERQRV